MTKAIYNRDAFIAKIAHQLGRMERLSVVEKPSWSLRPQDEVLKGADAEKLLAVLKKQCELIHTNLIETTKEELPEALHRTVVNYGGGPIVTWKDERFTQFGLFRMLYEQLPKEHINVHEWDVGKGEENIRIVERANIGITISDITLAESGTVVLFSGKDKGRTVSFLPLHSIIIVPRSTIVPRMTQAMRIIQERMREGEYLASCVNFITGPSNSADIEMNLVVGVHGPVAVTYIVVDDL